MTVRQIFYAAEVAELVPKTEAGYRRIQRLLSRWRRQGELSWSFIADGMRVRRQLAMWGDVTDFVEDLERRYRRNLWRDQGALIEVWLEKDALSEVVFETTSKWQVPLMVSRGQSSITFLHAAAQDARRDHSSTTGPRRGSTRCMTMTPAATGLRRQSRETCPGSPGPGFAARSTSSVWPSPRSRSGVGPADPAREGHRPSGRDVGREAVRRAGCDPG